MTAESYYQWATQVASFPATCDDRTTQVISPGGNWLAISCGYSNNQTLEIVNKAGQRWLLDFKDYLPADVISNGGTPMGGLFPKHWTVDDQFLYFSSYIAFDGGGTCFYGFGTTGLFRINLETGIVTTVLPVLAELDGYLISFSPDGRMLAYGVTYSAGLVIVNLRTGEKNIINVEENSVGGFTWSPDSSQLAFSTCQADEDYLNVIRSTIRIFDIVSKITKTIMTVEENFLSIGITIENRYLEIENYDPVVNKFSLFHYDWATGELTQATSNP